MFEVALTVCAKSTMVALTVRSRPVYGLDLRVIGSRIGPDPVVDREKPIREY
ncbi:MAG: hypothetical protein ACJAR9_001257 [Celeribacter sp.]|jgi:hypothetical protein